MAARLPVLGLQTHQQKVCSLYKRAVRNLESWYHRRDRFRYEAVVMRARFDENKNVVDMIQANQLIEKGEEELFRTMHYSPKQFPMSPGGVAYQREVIPPDWVLDYWHPLEKAHYPEYFKRREQRKKEFVVWWEKQYGKPNPDDYHH